MSTPYEPLEELYASDTFGGLLRSTRSLLKARRIIQRNAIQIKFSLSIIFMVPIFIYAVTFEAFQRIRFALKGLSRKHPTSMWDDYLHWGLREDLGNFTNETTGYHQERPEEATSLDDMSAWVMAVVQFVWTYRELLGVIWDEWTLLRLIMEAAQEAELDGFSQLDRQWGIQRPYKALLNGTYADMRREKFDEFYSQALENLPAILQENVARKYETLSASKRAAFQEQMSVLARVEPNRFRDEKKPIMLWDAHIALVVGGRYHLISLVERDANGAPVAYGIDGSKWALEIRDGYAVGKKGERLRLEGDQLLRVRDDKKVGWLDMPSVARVKWQSRQILSNTDPDDPYIDPSSVDVLLAETPRRAQKGLRKLLTAQTQRALESLAYVPVIINWDEQSSERNLAEIRRTNRGIGDHALTIIRTEGTIVFDLAHLFFDGTWSLAVAEVMTNMAIEWCRRIVHITPVQATAAKTLNLNASRAFLKAAYSQRQPPEISAETTIHSIESLSNLRTLLKKTGTLLTVNDLLVTTRIFHAAHYRPSPAVQKEIDTFKQQSRLGQERRAAAAIKRSLKRGRITNPALAIPIDASLHDPQARLHMVVFRNMLYNLVWIWDDTWDAYQAYRRIEPPDTPEGIVALGEFSRKQAHLIGILRAFSLLLAANKAVGRRGNSLSVAMSELLVGLPMWLQHILNLLPENLPVLNEVIKGDEIYSNVGRVAEGSSLSRFITVKDDGNAKELAWGIMTDDQDRMIVTMRDFRPHVKPLAEIGRLDLARTLAQDYVVAYTNDLIGLVARLTAMLRVEMEILGGSRSRQQP